MDPLDVSHGQNRINIVTGKISNKKCQCWRRCSDWRSPAGRIRAGLSHRILPNDQKECYYHEGRQEQRGVDPMEQYGSWLIFARVAALMSTRAINLNDVLKYELAAVPTSIFDEKSGELRTLKSKSILKRRLQVEVTNPSRGTGDAVVIDGCAILWVLQWPTKDSSRISCWTSSSMPPTRCTCNIWSV